MNFYKYIDKIKDDSKYAVKVEWLNPDETVNFEFTNALYDISASVEVNYQQGCRRACTLTLNNDNNKFPINFNNIWIGQKFKLWMGIYIDEKTPYYLPQGVFYVSNPNDTYNPTTRTITINGVDKWAFLDGTLHGKLSDSYQTNIGVDLYDAIKKLLKQPTGETNAIPISVDNISEYFDIENGEYYFEGNGNIFKSNNDIRNSNAITKLVAKRDYYISFEYKWNTNIYHHFSLSVGKTIIEDNVVNEGSGTYKGIVFKGDVITFSYRKSDNTTEGSGTCSFFDMTLKDYGWNIIDPILPKLSPDFIGKTAKIPVWNENQNKYVEEEKEVLKCPYTATVERGRSYADILLEYATILCANIYYDVNGRLVVEPMINTADDITDTNKEILWDFTVDEKTFLGLTQTYSFDKVYNDFIVLGNIVNGYQFKARVQNRNPRSDTCIQRIGIKTKEPYENNQYYSDEQCEELAIYYAKTHTILQKSGSISSVPLYHLDVNKLVTVSTPNNNMSKELFLIKGFSLSPSETMSISVASVNVLNDFSVVGVDIDDEG